MKLLACFVFSLLFILSASAQSRRNKYQRPAEIDTFINNSISRIPAQELIEPKKCPVHEIRIKRSKDSYDLAEASVMKTAQHNMGHGVFYEASYNFSDLARLYMAENRLSEAKWYFLQSINLSRQQNDFKHTVANLIDLAVLKAKTGDYTQALADLAKASEIARVKGFFDNLEEIGQAQIYFEKKKDKLVKL